MVTIFDPLYLRIELNPLISKLLKTAEAARIGDIKQLGPGYISFPGATHTRFEHSLGVAHLALLIAKNLGLNEQETNEVCVAALLHDIGHGPFSHTTDELLENTLKKHDERARDIILGETHLLQEDKSWLNEKIKSKELYKLSDILKDIKVDAKKIGAIVVNKDVERYLGQIINSPIDVDRMDFILRDAHYTGITHGIHNPEILLKYIRRTTDSDYLVYKRRGLSWLEQLLMARIHMYEDVYFEERKRIMEKMIARTFEYLTLDKQIITPHEIQAMTDTEAVSLFKKYEETSEIAKRLKYQIPFKTILDLKYDKIGPEELSRLNEINDFEKRRRIEKEIRENAEIERPIGVIIDIMPLPEFRELEISIQSEDGSIRFFSHHSPFLGPHFQKVMEREWFFRVYTLPEFGEKVKSVTISILKENKIDLARIFENKNS